MPLVEVLKFGRSALRSAQDLHVALDEICRRWRPSCHGFGVVSAVESVTDRLIRAASDLFGSSCAQAAAA